MERGPTERGSLQARRDRLSSIAPKVGPVAFARDRLLPVLPPLQGLLPEGGLVRGTVIGCHGATATSVALATAAGASAAGTWLAVVGVPSLGLRAASELGIALERLVMVADAGAGADPAQPAGAADADGASATLLSALIDGFDLVVMRAAPHVRAGTARRLQSRLHARGAVLIVIGDPGHFICDVTITTGDAAWEGLGHGSGRLVRRRVTLSAVGRRSPRARHLEVWLPGADGGLEAVLAPASPGARPIDETGTDTGMDTGIGAVVAVAGVLAELPAFRQTG